MTRLGRLLPALAPGLFVLFWSTGFISARYATDDNGPLAFLAVRLTIAGVVLSLVAPRRERRLTRAEHRSSAITAMGMHVAYLGGVWVAIDRGMTASLSSLIAGLQPVLVALLAARLLGERVRSIQWVGVVLGFAGVVWFTVDQTSGQNVVVPTVSWVVSIVSLLGIVGGTLWQRRHNVGVPLLGGTGSQYLASAAAFAVLALTIEREPITVTPLAVFAMVWAVVMLSFGSTLLMLWLLQRGEASRVSALVFLTPPLSAIEAFVLFGDPIGAAAVAALAVSAVGVWLVLRTPADPRS